MVAGAARGEPGSALYVPSQGNGRIDNPLLYSVLYLSDAAAGAVAEAFGRFPEWSAAILTGSPSLPGSTRTLAQFDLSDEMPVCDLDDPVVLTQLGLRPSDVVTRDYERSRAWAREIHAKRKWAGVRWWSYYDARWASFGFWDIRRLRLVKTEALRLDHPAMEEAARVIARRIVPEQRLR